MEPDPNLIAEWKARRSVMRADYEASKEALPEFAEFLKRVRDRLDTDPLTLEPVLSVRTTPLSLTVHRAASNVYHAPRVFEIDLHLEDGVKVRHSDEKAVHYAGIVREGASFKLVSRDSNGTPTRAELHDVWNAWLERALAPDASNLEEGVGEGAEDSQPVT